ncbi:MAG: hypothetical protein EBY21_01560 [Alphaproteobacteria bacterium]|nr:hypothetical protein [Alphaproteobacteria bacterium]
MLSALVHCPALRHHTQASSEGHVSSEAIVRTLGALVPAIIEGILRDVILVAAAADQDLQHIADHAGCALLEANAPAPIFQQGLKAMRGQNVFILRAGLIPDSGFADELADCLAERVTSCVLREHPQTMLQRLLPNLAPIGGLLVSKDTLLTHADMIRGRADLDPILRAVRPKKLLRARLRRAH